MTNPKNDCRRNEITTDSRDSITLLLYVEKELFTILAIEWTTVVSNNTNTQHGQQKWFEQFNSEEQANKAYEHLLTQWS